MEVLPDATATPDLSIRACEAQGPLLDWDSYWGEQNVHFVLRSALLPCRAAGATRRCTCPLGTAGDIFTHPEALLYIDGCAVASADRYHHTIDLDTALAGRSAP